MMLHEWREKIKSVRARVERRDFFFAAAIILVGLASFGLGRLSKLEDARLPVRIEPPPAETQAAAVGGAAPSVPRAEGQVVASKSGTKYHFPWCAGAAQISEQNKVWFSSIEEARKAGYTPASNCKGLQ